MKAGIKMDKRQILVLNSGSSSLKFKLFSLPDLEAVASGMVENIGLHGARGTLKWDGQDGPELLEIKRDIAGHKEAIELMSKLFRESGMLVSLKDIAGIGHRVVHGGERFRRPVLLDRQVVAEIKRLIPLAPLHNPANLMGIEVAMEHAPETAQVAVFDTAFHQTIPDHAYLYALPYELYEKHKVRRYGFHGTSHGYVARRAAQSLGVPLEELNIITLHLGNGASAAAIKGGRSVDTSMGLTPLEGLIMGTRSGDIDPAIIFYLAREYRMELQELDELLNRRSGLKGICGESDMRTITERAANGDRLAELALSMFCYRIRKYIGAYFAALEGADCLVFTGGIGENSAEVRKRCCKGLERLGIEIDHAKNSHLPGNAGEISTENSRIKILVIKTDEELEIALQTREVIQA